MGGTCRGGFPTIHLSITPAPQFRMASLTGFAPVISLMRGRHGLHHRDRKVNLLANSEGIGFGHSKCCE